MSRVPGTFARSRSRVTPGAGALRQVPVPAREFRPSWLERADHWRHRIPFWWWLTYDALVGVVIVAGTSPSEWAFWLGWAVLFIAVVIDAVEFWVKRPASRAKLAS